MAVKRKSGARKRSIATPEGAFEPQIPAGAPEAGSQKWGWLAAAGALGLLLSCHFFFPASQKAFFAVGGFSLALLLLGLQRLPALNERDPSGRGRAALLLLFGFLLYQGWQTWLDGALRMVLFSALALWLLRPPVDLPARETETALPGWAKACLAGLLLAGTWLRFHDLLGVPNGVNSDEVTTAALYHAFEAKSGSWFHGWNSEAFHWLGAHSWVMALVHKFGPDGYHAMRLSHALTGSLALWMTFLLVRSLFGWRSALWATAFMAFSCFAIAGSRMCIYDSTGVFFAALLGWLLLKGLKGSWFWFLPLGLLAGIFMHGRYYTHYGFSAFLATFLVLSVFFRKTPLVRGLFSLALALALFAWVFGSMFQTIKGHYPWYDFLSRYNVVGGPLVNIPAQSNKLERLKPNLQVYRDLYTVQGSPDTVTQVQGQTLLDGASSALLLLGLLTALGIWLKGRGEGMFALGFFSVTLLPGLLSDIYAVPYRISMQAPMLFGLMGLAADQLSRQEACVPMPWLRRLGLWLCLGMVAYSAFWGWRQYFVRYPQSLACRDTLGGIHTEVARELRALPKDRQIYVSDVMHEPRFRAGMLEAMALRKFTWSGEQLSSIFPDPRKAGAANLYQWPQVARFEPSLRELYPGLKLQLVEDFSKGAYLNTRDPSAPGKGKLWASIEISREDIDAASGLEWEPKSASGRQKGRGALAVDAAGRWILRKGAAANWTVRVDGKEWKDGEARDLGRGNYRFEATAADKAVAPVLEGPQGSSLNLADVGNFRPSRFARGARANFYHISGENPDLSTPSEKALKLQSDLHFGRGI